MGVSLRSKAKEAATNDIRVGLADIKADQDEQGVFWLLPGRKTKVRDEQEAKTYARRLNDLISYNLSKGTSRSVLT